MSPRRRGRPICVQEERSIMSQNNVELQMSIPLDEDGFLRRECPHCEQQFKWHPTQDEKVKQVESSELPTYFCPLCGESAKADAWWTREQIEHATALTKAQVVGPIINDFQAGLRRLNRPGSSLRVTANPVRYSPPAPMAPELNDMRVVVPLCHPDEPVKVPEEWRQPVHCLICGQTTTVECEE